MKPLGILISLICVSGVSQDYPYASSQQTTSIPGARYEIVQSPLAAKWTFRLDRITGRVWQLVKTNTDNSAWEEMPVYRPIMTTTTKQQPRYQIFSSGIAARHTFLIDSLSGTTWALVTNRSKNSDGKISEIIGWERFEE